MTDRALQEALRTAGYPQVADQLRDQSIVADLRGAGHEDVAAALEAKSTPQRPGEPAATPEPQSEAEAFAAELAGALNKNTTTLPNFLSE